MKRPRFRSRLFTILLLFAVCPSVLLTLLWTGTVSSAASLVSGSAAWERAAATGASAIALARAGRPLTPAEQRALDAHEQELRGSLELSRRYSFVAPRVARALLAAGVVGLVALTVIASRVAGHLSRQLSRPIDQLVRWTALVQAGKPVPDEPEPRGAPEFGTLRLRMRTMSRELARGRAQALETERAEAFRETARRVAHELKNPLTPIRFAVDVLRRDAARADGTPAQRDAVEVLAAETARLEAMARSFAQFGRLPDGTASEVDVGEMARAVARTTVPATIAVDVEVAEDAPLVRGHHDALARALSNVLLNAVDACAEGGTISVRVAPTRAPTSPGVSVAVRDTGCGIAEDRLAHIWDPYVTHKPDGTGLGLAIARQTVVAHGGSVDAVSALGRGTEVRFILPVVGPPSTAPWSHSA